jgi:hypothetical protein
MSRRAEAVPQIPPHFIENLGELLKELKQFGLTLGPIQAQSPSTLSYTIHDFVPDISPFSGSFEQDGISIDEWRIRMRMKLKQLEQIKEVAKDEAFKGNYILSMLSGRAFIAVRDRHVIKAGSDPANGFGSAERVLEEVCDVIREKCASAISEKAAYGS